VLTAHDVGSIVDSLVAQTVSDLLCYYLQGLALPMTCLLLLLLLSLLSLLSLLLLLLLLTVL
jgi:hypothetical protein